MYRIWRIRKGVHCLSEETGYLAERLALLPISWHFFCVTIIFNSNDERFAISTIFFSCRPQRQLFDTQRMSGINPSLGIFPAKSWPKMTLFAVFRLFIARCTNDYQSNSTISTFYRAMHVVLARYCYRKSSVRLSVRLSVCNVDVPWTYRLDYFKSNCMSS